MQKKILSAAYLIACKKGYRNLRKREVAQRAEVAEGSVSYHFGTMGALQDAVLMLAAQENNVVMLAHAWADQNEVARSVCTKLQTAIREYILAS